MSEPSNEQAPQRISKARQRQMKRQQRRTTQSVPPARPERARAAPAAPAGSLPQIDLALLRPIGLALGALVFMAALIFGVGLFTSEPTPPDVNALWIDSDWSYAAQTDAAVDALADRLRDNDIGTVYVDISVLAANGTWTGRPNTFSEVEDSLRAARQQLHDATRNVQVFGTIYVPSTSTEGGSRLEQPAIQDIVADFSRRVVDDLGYDGVMLVVQPVGDGDESFLELLRRVRQAIGDDRLLAVAVPPDWTPTDVDVPMTDALGPGVAWSRDYKQRVALSGVVDQIVVQSYHSYLNDPADYSAWLAYQVAAYADAIGDLEADTRVLIGIPTYATDLPAHDERVENVASAVEGIERGLADAGELAWAIQGTALFNLGDTEEIEWEQFRSLWVRR